MKFTATKKTIVILIVSFFVLVLGVISFIYRDFISNGINTGRWFTLDKYEELLEDCEYSKNEHSVEVVCKGLLETIKKPDSGKKELCPSVLVFNKKTLTGKYLKICIDDEENLHWDNPYGVYDKYIPIIITLGYEKTTLSTDYTLSKISLDLMSDDEFLEIADKNKDVQKSLGYIAMKKNSHLSKYNYYIEDRLESDTFPDVMTIMSLRLKEAELVEDQVRMVFTGELKEEPVSIEISTTQLLHVYLEKKSNQLVEQIMSKDNYTDLIVGAPYQLHLLSLSGKEVSKIEEILSDCREDLDKKDLTMTIFCNAGEEKIRNSIIGDREAYIDTLLVTNTEYIRPEKFILFSLFKQTP